MKLKRGSIIKRLLRGIYYFLPVQLLLLHFRKYQLLLGFWLILLFTITGDLAARFGGSSLFLAPEYLGNISFMSMFLLGGAMCVFIMSWHITTFIIHSKRIPYMGATRNAFMVYCYNNAVLPIAFLVFYSSYTIHYQWHEEHFSLKSILLLQSGFYLGLLFLFIVSFAYFFRVSRDFFKTIFSNITNPARIRKVIPYDSLDYDLDIIPSRSYLSGTLRIEKSADLPPYQPRVMNTIMSRHHRNVIFAALIAYLLLLVMGIYIDQPILRVPAGASFLLLCSIVMGVVGAFKYFMKSWETIGWIIFVLLISAMVKYQVFDLRSIAYGLNYHGPANAEPVYDYDNIRKVFTADRFYQDRNKEEGRLQQWKAKATTDSTAPPLVIITVSGGGSRSAYWTFRALQYADSATGGQLFKKSVLITGASGGMIGAAYWRSLHDACQQGLLKDPYARSYQDNVGKDLLNSIIFSLASVDMISPFNKIKVSGYSYTRDRGFAMEQELIRNTDGLLDKNIGYFKDREATGIIPQLIVNGTIVNDGRRMVISNQPAGYLTQPEHTLNKPNPPVDVIDFATFYAGQNPYNLRLTSALRMNATFPFVLPVVKLPARPSMNIMDAGLSDNFGNLVATRYISVLRKWIADNAREVIFLEIRDTREFDVASNSDQTTLAGQVFDPLFVIQDKWEAFQSSSQAYLRDVAPPMLQGKLRFIKMEYVPREPKKAAALNFHLTQKEKEDIYMSIDDAENRSAVDTLVKLLRVHQ